MFSKNIFKSLFVSNSTKSEEGSSIFGLQLLKPYERFIQKQNFGKCQGSDRKSLFHLILTLPVPIPDEEKKLSYIFIFTLLCRASKGFRKALKTFIKPFETPERSEKIKISLNFFSNTTFRKYTRREGFRKLNEFACF